MDKFPREVINKILFFLIHPVADIMREELESREYDRIYDEERYHNTLRYEQHLLEMEQNPHDYCNDCPNLLPYCNCICDICHRRYRICQYSCYMDRYCDCCSSLWSECHCI